MGTATLAAPDTGRQLNQRDDGFQVGERLESAANDGQQMITIGSSRTNPGGVFQREGRQNLTRLGSRFMGLGGGN